VSPVLLKVDDWKTQQRQWQKLQQQQQQEALRCLSALGQLTAVEISPQLLLEKALAPFGRLSQLRELKFRGGQVMAPRILAGAFSHAVAAVMGREGEP
jgi:hypothetical protein